MSRSGYNDDCDDILAYGRWRGVVSSATRGKRGQSFFKDLISALESMPEKRLITNELRKAGEVCALGALGVKRGINLESIDPEDPEVVAANFGIAEPLAREVVHMNDEACEDKTPEERWSFMHDWAAKQVNSEAK